MALDADRYRLTEDEHQAIFERRIKPELYLKELAPSWRGESPAPCRLVIGKASMKLTPHQILQHLGFEVPAGGIEVSAEDSLYHVTALQLLGRTLSVANIPDRALHERHARLLASHDSNAAPSNDAEGAEKSRATLRAMVKVFYGASV